MARLQIKRGTRAQIDAAAALGTLYPGEPYLITDEDRLALGITTSSYEVFAKVSEAGGDVSALANEIETARAGRSDLNARIRTISNFASPNAGGYVSGRWYDGGFHAANSATQALQADTITLGTFYSSQDVNMVELSVGVATAVASALVRVVLYGSTTEGWPHQLLYESADVDCSSNGAKNFAPGSAISIAAATQYWIGLRSNSNPVIRCIPLTSASNLGLPSANATAYACGLRRSFSFASAAPTTWAFDPSDIPASGNALPPSIRFRSG